MTACVIGVGNELRGDDAVGLVVARRLRADVPDVAVVECEGEPVALLDAWRGYDRAFVVDATQTGGAPGTVCRIAAHEGPLPAELRRPSTHLLGVADAVELARTLGRLPRETVVYGVEGESFAAGAELSPRVAQAVGGVVAALRRELEA
jgi:hydrogenase maturation protease